MQRKLVVIPTPTSNVPDACRDDSVENLAHRRVAAEALAKELIPRDLLNALA